MMKTNRTYRRGFGSLNAQRRREIAREGGKASHRANKSGGRAHEFTSREAARAGHKGGKARQARMTGI